MIIVLRQSLEFRCHQEAKIVYFVPLETVSLADAAHREVQRRSEASVDHAAVLPPDVVAVLTMFDASEREKEGGHNNAHIRFADSITRFFDKLRTEETKYNNRMEELQVRKILNFINEIRTALREFKTDISPQTNKSMYFTLVHLTSRHVIPLFSPLSSILHRI